MAIQLPSLKIDYLLRSTDDTGIFQHAKYCIPKRTEGYTTDDNARALVACVRYHRLKKDSRMEALAHVYLAFLNHMQKPDGNFHNYLGYNRTFLDVDGSQDCIGRTLWGCGSTVNSQLPKDLRMVAKEILEGGLPWVWKTTSLRFCAHTIMGLSQYYQATADRSALENITKLADGLLLQYHDECRNNWHWFEPNLTYDNARLTQAVFVAYGLLGDKKYLEVAEESMDFLLKTHMNNDVFVPIGNNGWYKRGMERAIYDQQPLEAAAMVEASVEAYNATKNKRYVKTAYNTFDWFLGKNSQNVTVYNSRTGGCCDGVRADSLNKNQGAESSICCLLARLRLEELNMSF